MYKNLELEVINFGSEDIITTSGLVAPVWPPPPPPPPPPPGPDPEYIGED